MIPIRNALHEDPGEKCGLGVLVTALRRIGFAGTEFAAATCGSIRLKLLKIGALVTRSVRRIRVAMASSCPDAAVFRLAHARLCG